MFPQIDRPQTNTRRAPGDWDVDVELSLRSTLATAQAVVIPLWQFHSSPAKGRLWAEGFSVKHRVQDNRQDVSAWLVVPLVPGL